MGSLKNLPAKDLLSPSKLIGPRLLIPYSITISRAIEVAWEISEEAPVVISLK